MNIDAKGEVWKSFRRRKENGSGNVKTIDFVWKKIYSGSCSYWGTDENCGPLVSEKYIPFICTQFWIKFFLKLIMAFRTPCLRVRLQLVTISSDGTTSDWVCEDHSDQDQVTTNQFEQPKYTWDWGNNSDHLLSIYVQDIFMYVLLILYFIPHDNPVR